MELNLLPVAEKELRAAAWRRNTYRLRWWTALLAIIGSSLWLTSASAPAMPTKYLSSLFDAQTACAFAFALLAGAFLAADCLSEERRDGTLSLLFLTGLRARDIVLGQFAGLLLTALYVLLALLPVTALPLLLGGVGFAEFWRMALALANTLFFSLALGLGISALMVNFIRGLIVSLALLLFFGVVLPALAAAGAASRWAPFWQAISSPSPLLPFRFARDARYLASVSRFWNTLFFSNLGGWMFLAVATLGVRRAWQAAGIPVRLAAPGPRPALAKSARLRRGSAERAFDPALRLAGDAPLLRGTAWLLVAGWGATVCFDRFWLGLGLSDLLMARICGFLLKALFAMQACRFFVETRRSGAIELLLCTPLRNEELVRVQWRLLLKFFLPPLGVFLGFAWVAAVISPLPMALGPGGTLMPLPDSRTGFLGIFILSFELAADVLAIGWFGMWLALTTRKPALAPAFTIVAVLLLPAMAGPFALVADMLFISWGTTRFQEEFRWMVPAYAPRRV